MTAVFIRDRFNALYEPSKFTSEIEHVFEKTIALHWLNCHVYFFEGSEKEKTNNPLIIFQFLLFSF